LLAEMEKNKSVIARDKKGETRGSSGKPRVRRKEAIGIKVARCYFDPAAQALRSRREQGQGESKGRTLQLLPKLSDLGVSKTQSSRWQQLAALDEDTFERRKA
jgi:hypothetical protein